MMTSRGLFGKEAKSLRLLLDSLNCKLDDVRADLDDVHTTLRIPKNRQLGVERSIGLVREDMARRDCRSDALASRAKRIERRLELSDHAGR